MPERIEYVQRELRLRNIIAPIISSLFASLRLLLLHGRSRAWQRKVGRDRTYMTVFFDQDDRRRWRDCPVNIWVRTHVFAGVLVRQKQHQRPKEEDRTKEQHNYPGYEPATM